MSGAVITRARKLLAAATPGPWDAEYHQTTPHKWWGISYEEGEITDRIFTNEEANAALIAAAPTLIEELCRELEAAREEREAHRIVCVEYAEDTSRQIAALRAELEAARREDDPELDGTDGAHPAWWRGNDAGCASTTALIERALTRGAGPDAGGVGYAPLERVRRMVVASCKVVEAARRRARHAPWDDAVVNALAEYDAAVKPTGREDAGG